MLCKLVNVNSTITSDTTDSSHIKLEALTLKSSIVHAKTRVWLLNQMIKFSSVNFFARFLAFSLPA